MTQDEAIQVQHFPRENVYDFVRSVVREGKAICLLGSTERELVGVILPQSDLNITVNTIERSQVEDLARTQGRQVSGGFSFAHETPDISEVFHCESGGGIECFAIKKRKDRTVQTAPQNTVASEVSLGRVEIVLGNGRVLRVAERIDPAVLARLAAALDRR